MVDVDQPGDRETDESAVQQVLERSHRQSLKQYAQGEMLKDLADAEARVLQGSIQRVRQTVCFLQSPAEVPPQMEHADRLRRGIVETAD